MKQLRFLRHTLRQDRTLHAPHWFFEEHILIWTRTTSNSTQIPTPPSLTTFLNAHTGAQGTTFPHERYLIEVADPWLPFLCKIFFTYGDLLCLSYASCQVSRSAQPHRQLHCVSYPQSWYFVNYFWHVPPAVGLILCLLCSPINNQNFREKTKQNWVDETRCIYSSIPC